MPTSLEWAFCISDVDMAQADLKACVASKAGGTAKGYPGGRPFDGIDCIAGSADVSLTRVKLRDLWKEPTD